MSPMVNVPERLPAAWTAPMSMLLFTPPRQEKHGAAAVPVTVLTAVVVTVVPAPDTVVVAVVGDAEVIPSP